MPRLSASGRAPAWADLYDVAAPQGGYFTTKQAAGAGYSPMLLSYHVQKGLLERWGRGIFRVVHFPVSAQEDLVPIWLWSEQKGVFSHETALALHGLSDALPSKHHIMLPGAWSKRRLRAPSETILQYGDLAAHEVAWKEHVPVTTVQRTIMDCIHAGVGRDLVRQAIAQSVDRGLVDPTDGQVLARMELRHVHS
jgi:predicted transcriptional regulator of viral defense system